jgi:hypothetical protein
MILYLSVKNTLFMDLLAFLSSAFFGQILLFPRDGCAFSRGYEVQVFGFDQYTKQFTAISD